MWWILAGFAALLIVLFYIWQNLTLDVTHICFESDRAQREVKVGLFSDLHGGRWLTDVVALAKKQKYDLIAIAGDLFDEKSGGNEGMIKLAEELVRIAPCVYVRGNHEYRIEEGVQLVQKLKALGVHVLENELCTLEVNGQCVTVAGLDAAVDQTGYFHSAAPSEKQLSLLKELSRSEGIRLVVDHYPENYALRGKDSYDRYAFETMFSGHAHGGQVRLPWIGGLYAPGQGVLPKYTKGLYQTDKNRLIVSGGMSGRWYLPRVFDRVQIVTVHIRPEK